MDNDRFPVRKNPRMRDYAYSTPNYYFITICTHQKYCLFGEPGMLNFFGKLAEHGLLNIEDHFPGVLVDKYVVMPNHIHAIFVLQCSDTDLSTVIGQYKSFVTKQIRATRPAEKVWQTSYHDHIIRNQTDYQRIWGYIDTNPLKWKEDCFYSDNSSFE